MTGSKEKHVLSTEELARMAVLGALGPERNLQTSSKEFEALVRFEKERLELLSTSKFARERAKIIESYDKGERVLSEHAALRK